MDLQWGLNSESQCKCFQFHTDVVGYCKGTPHPHNFCLGFSLQKSLSTGTQCTDSITLGVCAVPQSAHAGWMFLEFQGVPGTVSAGIPPRTTGNTKHSCRYNLFSHFDTWTGKKVKTLWLFSEMPGNWQCVFLDQYPNMGIEIHVCRTFLSCQVCRQPVWFCVPKINVQGAPGLETVDKPWAQQARHITSLHTLFYPRKQEYSSSRYLISVLEEQAAALFKSDMPMESRLWLPADDRAAAQIGSVMLPDTACAAGIVGLGTHVTLTKGLCKHKASALLSWTFMVPNEYFMCDTKIATILWATSNRPLSFWQNPSSSHSSSKEDLICLYYSSKDSVELSELSFSISQQEKLKQSQVSSMDTLPPPLGSVDLFQVSGSITLRNCVWSQLRER